MEKPTLCASNHWNHAHGIGLLNNLDPLGLDHDPNLVFVAPEFHWMEQSFPALGWIFLQDPDFSAYFQVMDSSGATSNIKTLAVQKQEYPGLWNNSSCNCDSLGSLHFCWCLLTGACSGHKGRLRGARIPDVSQGFSIRRMAAGHFPWKSAWWVDIRPSG